MTKPFVITSKNVKSVFDTLNAAMDQAAQAQYLLIDFEFYWPMSPRGEAVYREAVRLNTRGKKVLPIGDARTRGGKYYLREKRAYYEALPKGPL